MLFAIPYPAGTTFVVSNWRTYLPAQSADTLDAYHPYFYDRCVCVCALCAGVRVRVFVGGYVVVCAFEFVCACT